MHLEPRTTRILQATVADKSAPAELRGACTDWLHRHQAGLELFLATRDAGNAARAALQQAKRDAPRQLELMLAAGSVTLEAVGAQLPDLRWQLDIAEDQHAITRRALELVQSQISSAPWRSCPDSILTWCASLELERHPRARLQEHQEHAWQQVAGRWQVLWPFEACELPGEPGAPPGAVLMLPMRTRLHLSYHAPPSQAKRHRWLWERIAAGEFQTRPGSGDQLELISSAPWRS